MKERSRLLTMKRGQAKLQKETILSELLTKKIKKLFMNSTKLFSVETTLDILFTKENMVHSKETEIILLVEIGDIMLFL